MVNRLLAYSAHAIDQCYVQTFQIDSTRLNRFSLGLAQQLDVFERKFVTGQTAYRQLKPQLEPQAKTPEPNLPVEPIDTSSHSENPDNSVLAMELDIEIDVRWI